MPVLKKNENHISSSRKSEIKYKSIHIMYVRQKFRQKKLPRQEGGGGTFDGEVQRSKHSGPRKEIGGARGKFPCVVIGSSHDQNLVLLTRCVGIAKITTKLKL